VTLSIDPSSPDRPLVPVIGGLSSLLIHLARLGEFRLEKAGPGAFEDVVAGLALGLTLPKGAAADAGERIEKSVAAADDEIAGLKAKLGNPEFVGKAPAAVVEKVRARLFELEEKRAALVRS
jgi:valyl-tRNA synthetase